MSSGGISQRSGENNKPPFGFVFFARQTLPSMEFVVNHDTRKPLSGDRGTKYHSGRGILSEKLWNDLRKFQFAAVGSAGQLRAWRDS